MKRILTLVLCWLIAFSAMAETTLKAKTALSAAGGYITSLNKVDGSFEDGSTQWSASVGTIVPTASTEFQGNYKGVWAGTGAGTLNLQWTATASNTYEASAQVNVNGEDDVYICAYVGTTETGCKLIPALNKIQKVSVVADSILSSAFNLRLKHTGSDAFSIDVDDGKIEPWTQQSIGVVEQESVTYTGYSSLDGGNRVKFKTVFENSGNRLLASDNSGTYTKFTVLKKTKGVVNANFYYGSGTGNFTGRIEHYNQAGTILKAAYSNGYVSSTSPAASISISGDFNAGDYFTVTNVQGFAVADVVSTNFSITATAISDNVVQSWQDGTEWKALTYTEVNALSGNQGWGTLTGGKVRYRRQGGNLLYDVTLKIGVRTASEARIPLPVGLLTDSRINSETLGTQQPLQLLGLASTKNAFAGNIEVYAEPNVGYVTFGYAAGSTDGMAKRNGNDFPIPDNGTLNFSVSVPIQGWSSAPTLLALPTSKENVFRVSINPNTNTVTSDPNGIVSSTSQTGGIVTVNFKSGVFASAPIVVSNYKWAAANDIYSRVESTSTSSATIAMLNAGTYRAPSDNTILDLIITRSSDYTAPGVFVGNVQPEWQYDLTVTGTNWTTTRAVGVVYKMASGQYRMKFNITGTVSSQSSNTLTISGVTFKNITNFYQAVSVNGTTNWNKGYTYPNAPTIEVTSGTTTTGWGISGDVELESKPTWASNTP